MEIHPKTPMRIYAALGAITGWFAVMMQFYLILLNRTVPAGETIIRFFSYFTILSNILAAITFTVVTVNLDTGVCRFCRRTDTLSAVTVYIVLVGIIYNLLLRSVWSPEGMQKLVDELLHSVMPTGYLLFWLLFVPKRQLKWAHSIPWLVFPLVYTAYITIRGSFSGFYPYPFIDVAAIGYRRAILNGIGMLALFLFISLMLIGIAKLITRGADNKSRVDAAAA